MKKLVCLSMLLVFVFVLVSCGNNDVSVDYDSAAAIEEALNNGEDVIGKVVTFEVNKLVPNSAFGYNMQAGEQLNFCSEKNPKMEEGDTVTVEVTEVSSVLGSYIISYKIVK